MQMESENDRVNMNASLDKFLAEYFANLRTTPSPGPSSTSGTLGVSNFSLGESTLMDNSDCFDDSSDVLFEKLDLDFENSSESFSSRSPESENSKILRIQAHRQSLSYDITFNQPTTGTSNSKGNPLNRNLGNAGRNSDLDGEIQIQMQMKDAKQVQQHCDRLQMCKASSKKITGRPNEVTILENKVEELLARNVELEKEVSSLKVKLDQAHKTIGELEVEVVNLYC